MFVSLWLPPSFAFSPYRCATIPFFLRAVAFLFVIVRELEGRKLMLAAVCFDRWPHSIVLEKEGPNDGLVSLQSAQWVRNSIRDVLYCSRRSIYASLTSCFHGRERISGLWKA